ncbi:MAG: hypothetical protein MRY83_06385 [Flavobacteriales bacterium]|nr:hypothetical protein [Flavobacteriales bacterium]
MVDTLKKIGLYIGMFIALVFSLGLVPVVSIMLWKPAFGLAEKVPFHELLKMNDFEQNYLIETEVDLEQVHLEVHDHIWTFYGFEPIRMDAIVYKVQHTEIHDFYIISENIEDTVLSKNLEIPFGAMIHSGARNEALYFGDYRNSLPADSRFILIPETRVPAQMIASLTLLFMLLALAVLILLIWLRWSNKGKKILKLNNELR